MGKLLRWATAHARFLGALLFWSATLFWMICIFNMSAQNATQSTGTSGGLISRLAPLLHRDFSSLSPAAKEEFVESLQNSVRNIAHLIEYALLGGLLHLAVGCSFKGKYLPLSISCGTGIIYAVTDEIHQIFVPGRAFELKDLLIDWAGVATGIIVAIILICIIKAIKTSATIKRSVQN